MRHLYRKEVINLKDLDEIYRLYVNDVYRYLLRMTGDPDPAEELTQETFFRAVNQIDKFRGETSIKAWLIVIAKNCFYSSKRSAAEKNISVDEMDYEPASDENITENLIKREDAKRLHRVVHELPEPYKEVFSLRIFGELSFRDIADLFGKTENWAKVTFYRAKAKVADRFSKEEAE